MNIYEKLQSHVVMPEAEIYKELRHALIEQDHIDYLGLILQRAAGLFADDTALICQDKKMSYRELYYYACQVSILLKEHGIKPNDRVLLLMENSMAFYVAYFGVIQIGAVVVPLNIFLHERELAHIIDDAKPSFFICASSRTEKIRECATNLPPMIDETELKLDATVPEYCILHLRLPNCLLMLW